jgi:hypothetical protein
MKQYQRSLAILAVLVISFAGNVHAQGVQPLWANYAVQDVNEFYNPLAGGNVLPGIIPGQAVVTNFLNFTGAIDMQAGVASNIPVGFTFDYNGSLTNTVNIGISGWVSFNIVDLAPGSGLTPSGPFTPTTPFVSVVDYGVPVTPANNNDLYSSVLPNNAVAPFWGTHYYRTNEPGYFPSTISYLTTSIADPNQNKNNPFARIYTLTVEWRNLNVNDPTNPNSIASFQMIIRQNPLANDKSAPDQRATIEFQYGSLGNGATVETAGAAVGAKDSAGFTHINALYQSANDPNDVANNTSQRTTCWPPALPNLCEPGRAIQLVPQGRSLVSTWGDGDVLLEQLNSPNPQVRNNQSLFVTVADAMAILQSSANAVPLDSNEGGPAFHGDANHDGQVFNPNYDAYFYYTTPYDAAYILMYLAGKLAYLPWPNPLPVPGYKSTEIHSTDVSGVVADVSNVSMNGNTVLLPITIRGNVNGPLSIQMDLKGLEASGVQFIGTKAPDGTIICSNASLGRISLATSGDFSDGAIVGYIELRAPANKNAEFDIENVQVNDVNLAPSHVALMLADGSASNLDNLEQNVPNPFVVSVSNETTIGFNLASPEQVTMRIIDVLGHEVRTLIAGEGRTAGYNTVQWDGRDGGGNVVSSGMYFYQLTTPDFTQSAKMQVVH